MEKNVIVKVEGLRKTFKLSKKQQAIQKTKDKVKVAVDCLDFEAYEGEIFGDFVCIYFSDGSCEYRSCWKNYHYCILIKFYRILFGFQKQKVCIA